MVACARSNGRARGSTLTSCAYLRSSASIFRASAACFARRSCSTAAVISAANNWRAFYAGVFGAGVCDRRKAMFCCTEDGRGAISRQLAPEVHVDTSAKVLTYLGPHLPKVVYVDALDDAWCHTAFTVTVLERVAQCRTAGALVW